MMQGIQTLGPGVADKMAAMGQFEDDQIAHVAEGEVIVPAPIMKYYPEVKEQVFAAIRDQGLEPEQFIVGNEMVAINPNTGVQEFGFLKKVFKKIKKIVKKAAPLILAAALPMAAPAVFGSGAVLGGAASKLAAASALDAAFKGGNLKDVLKAGATGAVVGGIGQFASNLATGGTGGYISGANYNPAAAGASNPTVDAINQGRQQAATSTAKGTQVADASGATGTMSDAGSFSPDYTATEKKVLDKFRQDFADEKVFRDQFRSVGMEPSVSISEQGIQAIESGSGLTYNDMLVSPANPARQLQYDLSKLDPNLVADAQATAASFQVPTTSGVESLVPPPVPRPTPPLGEYSNLSLSGNSSSLVPNVTTEGVGSLDLSAFDTPPAETVAETGKKGFFETVKQNFKEKPLPTTLGALSTASLAAPLFMEDEVPEQSSMTVSREELGELLGGEEFLNYAGTSLGGLYYNPETQQYQDVPYVQSSGIMTAAGGGHIMGPGTGTSDSIPAYLSDGEFVMTADAVKGAGNGDRKKGAAKMYAMMSKFEGQA